MDGQVSRTCRLSRVDPLAKDLVSIFPRQELNSLADFPSCERRERNLRGAEGNNQIFPSISRRFYFNGFSIRAVVVNFMKQSLMNL